MEDEVAYKLIKLIEAKMNTTNDLLDKILKHLEPFPDPTPVPAPDFPDIMEDRFALYRRMTRIVSYPEHANPDLLCQTCKQSKWVPEDESLLSKETPIVGEGLGFCPTCGRKIRVYIDKNGKRYDAYNER